MGAAHGRKPDRAQVYFFLLSQALQRESPTATRDGDLIEREVVGKAVAVATLTWSCRAGIPSGAALPPSTKPCRAAALLLPDEREEGLPLSPLPTLCTAPPMEGAEKGLQW